MTKTKHLAPIAILTAIGAFAAYPYALKYVAGYLDMTAWANPHTLTNFTVGVVGAFLAFGAVLGYYLPKKVYYKYPKRKRDMMTACTTAVLAIIFCWMLALAGVPGFRFW